MTRHLSPMTIVPSTRRNCCALILGTAAVLAGCGGGSSNVDLQKQIDDAVVHLTTEPFPTPFMCSSNPSYCTETPVPSPAASAPTGTVFHGSSTTRSAAIVSKAAASTITPDMLMDWAETAIPDVFPGHSATVTRTGFVFRFYAKTNNFVAVADDGGVYVLFLNTSDQVKYVAPIAEFTCLVAPTSCTVLSLSKVTADPTVPNYSLMMYPQKFTVKLLDQDGKPVANQSVTWTANGNGWTIPSTSVTAADGTAQVNWVPGYGVSVPQMTATASNYKGTTTVTYSGALKADVKIDGSKTPNVSFSEYWSGTGVTGISREITPLTEPTGTYYAVIGWNAGYTGIQRGGTTFDRQIQFSAWNVNGVASSIVDAGTSKCQDFSHEGSGVMCANTYPWAINKTYRFEMTTATVVAGYTDITMYFVDVASGSRLFLATLRQAGALSMGSAYSFSEDFTRNAVGCQNVPERRAVFGNTKVLKGAAWSAAQVASRYSYITDPTTTCANSGYTLTNNGYELGIGGTVHSTSAVGGDWVLAKQL